MDHYLHSAHYPPFICLLLICPSILILSTFKRQNKNKLDDSLMMVIQPDHFLLNGKKLNTLSSEICVCSFRQDLRPSNLSFSLAPEFIQISISSKLSLIFILMPFMISMNLFLGLIVEKRVLYQSLLLFFFYIFILKHPPPALLTSYHMGFTPSLNKYISQSISRTTYLSARLLASEIGRSPRTPLPMRKQPPPSGSMNILLLLSYRCLAPRGQNCLIIQSSTLFIIMGNLSSLPLVVYLRFFFFICLMRKVFLIIINMIANRLTQFLFSSSSRLFIFAGQGTQQKGMLSSIDRNMLERYNEISKKLLQLDLEQIASTDKNSLINQTEVTQPLLLFSHYLHFQQNHAPSLTHDDFMIGHSLGEFSALVNARSLSFEDGLKLVHQRGSLMKKHTTSPHGMLIVKYKPQKQEILLQQIKKYEVEIACINSKTSIIAAGKKQKINDISKQLKKHQIVSMNLPVSTAFHCKMLENMKEQFNQILQKTSFDSPFCTVVRNYDCKIYQNAHDIRQGLLNQLTNPVLFYQSVKTIDKGVQFFEVGHKKWISKFVQEVRCDI